MKAYPSTHQWYTAFIQAFAPCKALIAKPNMLFILLVYTVYTNITFATTSIIGQLYYTDLAPDTLEYSLYSLTTFVLFVICTTAFYVAHRIWKFKLEKCFILGYALILMILVWGCIGIAKQDTFGYKNRWELYMQLLISQTSSALVNPTFRLLYAELILDGEEVMWYGMQVVLSCATIWVTYIATGPLQNSTHDLRFPLILCAVLSAVALGLEGSRLLMNLKAKARPEDMSGTTVEKGIDEKKALGTGQTIELP